MKRVKAALAYLRNLAAGEPVVVAGGVVGLIQVAALAGLVDVSTDQLAALSTALVGILTLLVRRKVTPTASLDQS